MNTIDTQIEPIKMFEEAILLTGQLYSKYSEQFFDHNGFWSNLSLAKAEHVGKIGSLRTKIYAGKIELNRIRFNKSAIQTFIGFVKGLLSRASKEKISIEHALEAASYLEWALMGQGIYKTFKKDPIELKEVLKRLAAASRGDRALLLKTRKKARSLSSSLNQEMPKNRTTTGETFLASYTGIPYFGDYPYGA